MKKIGVMVAATHSCLDLLFAGYSNILFLDMMADRNKVYSGQRVLLYEKRRPVYGCAMVVGEAKLQDVIPVEGLGFPYRPLFRYWVENVRQDNDLLQQVERIGETKLPGYDDSLLFLQAMDKEYLEYILQYGRLPDSYNDYWHDYVQYPYHSQAREKMDCVLGDYESWLDSISCNRFYDTYGRKQAQMVLILSDAEPYPVPMEVCHFKMENGKPFTRAPQYLTYTKE